MGCPGDLILLLSEAAPHNVASWRGARESGARRGGSPALHIWALLSDELKKPFAWDKAIAATAAGLGGCTFLSNFFFESSCEDKYLPLKLPVSKGLWQDQ